MWHYRHGTHGKDIEQLVGELQQVQRKPANPKSNCTEAGVTELRELLI